MIQFEFSRQNFQTKNFFNFSNFEISEIRFVSLFLIWTVKQNCRTCDQVLAELENIDDECDEYGIQMVKLQDPPLAKRYGIKTFPSLVYFRNGNPLTFDGNSLLFMTYNNCWLNLSIKYRNRFSSSTVFSTQYRSFFHAFSQDFWDYIFFFYFPNFHGIFYAFFSRFFRDFSDFLKVFWDFSRDFLSLKIMSFLCTDHK